MRRGEGAKPAQVRARHRAARFDLGSELDLTVPLEQQVDLGAVIRAPVEEPRLRVEVVDETHALGDDPLLEQPAPRRRIYLGEQPVVEGIGHAGVEEIEAGMSDEAGARALSPRFEPESDERVLQDLEVLPHRPGGHPGVARDRDRIQDVAGLRGGHTLEHHAAEVYGLSAASCNGPTSAWSGAKRRG